MSLRQLTAPVSVMKRLGVWSDVSCIYTFKFLSSEVSVSFKVDVYGELSLFCLVIFNRTLNDLIFQLFIQARVVKVVSETTKNKKTRKTAFLYALGMSNMTKVTTAGSPIQVTLSTYGFKDVSNVNITWNIAGSIDNQSQYWHNNLAQI